MGIKRNRPLMIDSHSNNNNQSKTVNLSTISDIININYNNNDDSNDANIAASSDHFNDDNEFINSHRQKRFSSSSFDHDYGLKKKMMRCDESGSSSKLASVASAAKGVIINDITDNLLKSSLGDTNQSYSSTTEDDQLKGGPFIDFAGESPSSIQNDLIGDDDDVQTEEQQQEEETAAAESLLNSNIFLNSEVNNKQTDEQSSLPILLVNNKDIKLNKAGPSGTNSANISTNDPKNTRYINCCTFKQTTRLKMSQKYLFKSILSRDLIFLHNYFLYKS